VGHTDRNRNSDDLSRTDGLRCQLGWWTFWIVVVVSGLGLKWLQTPYFIFGAADDDQLMVVMAKGFLEGHWSSPWATTGTTSLAKPAGFPIFLAMAHFFPWTSLFSNYLLYVVGALLISWSWRRISGSRAQTTVILIALICNPIVFYDGNQRIYRDVFIDAIATFGIGLAFVVAAQLHVTTSARDTDGRMNPTVPVHRRRVSIRSRMGRAIPFALCALLGVTIGWVAICKPTWIWLPVAVAAPLAYPTVRRIRQSWFRVAVLLKVGLAGLLVVLGAYGVTETTKLMNKRTYGVALVEDFSSGAFSRTWELWASVEAGRPEEHVQVTKAMREAVYRVSPTARSMETYLESPSDPWKAVDCASQFHLCTDSGFWFEWDLRSAASSTGQVISEVTFQRFFTKIANDISHACTTGRLRCTSSPVLGTGLVPLNHISMTTVAGDTASGMWQMLHAQLPMGPLVGPQPTADQYDLWSSVIPSMQPIGVVAHDSGPSWLYSLLDGGDFAFGGLNGVLLTMVCLGAVIWIVFRLSHRGRASRISDAYTASLSGLFLVSSVVGMGILAVFNVGQGPLFVNSLYWTDFATPAELFLVFGAIAAWPVFRHQVQAVRSARKGNHSGRALAATDRNIPSQSQSEHVDSILL
jgi:hypothetical protein